VGASRRVTAERRCYFKCEAMQLAEHIEVTGTTTISENAACD
jgi:hypothetical protein